MSPSADARRPGGRGRWAPPLSSPAGPGPTRPTCPPRPASRPAVPTPQAAASESSPRPTGLLLRHPLWTPPPPGWSSPAPSKRQDQASTDWVNEDLRVCRMSHGPHAMPREPGRLQGRAVPPHRAARAPAQPCPTPLPARPALSSPSAARPDSPNLPRSAGLKSPSLLPTQGQVGLPGPQKG